MLFSVTSVFRLANVGARSAARSWRCSQRFNRLTTICACEASPQAQTAVHGPLELPPLLLRWRARLVVSVDAVAANSAQVLGQRHRSAPTGCGWLSWATVRDGSRCCCSPPVRIRSRLRNARTRIPSVARGRRWASDAATSRAGPVWPAGAAQSAGRPRLAKARGSLRRDAAQSSSASWPTPAPAPGVCFVAGARPTRATCRPPAERAAATAPVRAQVRAPVRAAAAAAAAAAVVMEARRARVP